ncbi:MAG: hypothetical protein WC859_00445 [Elusimicrobiota bacterium]
MQRLRLLILLSLLTSLPLNRLSAQEPPSSNDPIRERTLRDQERLKQWDEEDRRLDKRNSWELPIAVVLIAAGAAFASRDMTYGYSASFAAATGLTIYFYTSRH